MQLIVADLGPHTITLTIETSEGEVLVMNTPERLATLIPPAD